jgi:tellurite resistance protein TehA-like permease
VIFEMATQIKYALIGFVSTLCGLALVLYRFIPRENIKPANPPHLG